MNAYRVERILMTLSNQSASSKLMRDVVALGKKYSKSGFPNPNREGCPTASSLRAMAQRDRHLTLGDLPVSHLVTCSPCFQQYAHFRRMSFLVRGLQITAATLGVIAVIFVTARLLSEHPRRSGERVTSENQLRLGQSPVATTQSGPTIAPFLLRVDLAPFSPTRGDATDDTVNKVHLPPKLLWLKLLLPLGMEPGEYTIQLQDANGTVIINKHAIGRLKDGATSVDVEIDLAGTRRGAFTLMIRPLSLSWRRFPVIVE
jgi:hypothetical protein